MTGPRDYDSQSESYDYCSIMHYDQYFFSRRQPLRTIERRDGGRCSAGRVLGGSVLTSTDLREIRKLYKC